MVTDAVGVPLASATVMFVDAPIAFPDIAASTDEHGRFSVSAPVAGTYHISVHADHRSPAELSVAVADVDVDVTVSCGLADPPSRPT